MPPGRIDVAVVSDEDGGKQDDDDEAYKHHLVGPGGVGGHTHIVVILAPRTVAVVVAPTHARPITGDGGVAPGPQNTAGAAVEDILGGEGGSDLVVVDPAEGRRARALPLAALQQRVRILPAVPVSLTRQRGQLYSLHGFLLVGAAVVGAGRQVTLGIPERNGCEARM